jgi:hypothetical protein
MSRRRPDRTLRELAPVQAGTRPRWLTLLAPFAIGLIVTALTVGLTHPFHSTPRDLASYDQGYAAGLRDGANAARADTLRAEAEAYRRGRAAPASSAPIEAPRLVDLLRRVSAGEVLLNTADSEDDATFRRGYLSGYTAGVAEAAGS